MHSVESGEELNFLSNQLSSLTIVFIVKLLQFKIYIFISEAAMQFQATVVHLGFKI